ncbi:MAG: ComF family protein [Opitutae bacterium]|nr:ComF family protein [Opitutae bacterium]
MPAHFRRIGKIGIAARKLLRFSGAFVDLFFPRNCVVTGEALGGNHSELVSATAVAKLHFINYHKTCRLCGGISVDGDNEICPHCLEHGKEFRFGCSRSAVVFDKFSRPIVHALKYHYAKKIARDIALLSQHSRGFYEHMANAILIPVPLHTSRLRKRGYNQSLFLAREFAKFAPGAVVDEKLLTRERSTLTQTQLDIGRRRENVRGAFRVSHRENVNPKARYVLIDDVFTTGATLSECARALRQAGAISIDAATFARAEAGATAMASTQNFSHDDNG